MQEHWGRMPASTKISGSELTFAEHGGKAQEGSQTAREVKGQAALANLEQEVTFNQIKSGTIIDFACDHQDPTYQAGPHVMNSRNYFLGGQRRTPQV